MKRVESETVNEELVSGMLWFRLIKVKLFKTSYLCLMIKIVILIVRYE
jgi:hypothetical protein